MHRKKPKFKIRKNLNKTYTIEELDGFLKQFNLNQALQLVASASKSLFAKSKLFEYRFRETEGVTEWGLAYISYRLLLSADDFMDHLMHYEQLQIASYKTSGIIDPFHTDNDLETFMLRLFDEQINVQEFTFSHVSSRYQLIYGKNPLFNQWFNDLHGMSLLDYFGVGFSIMAIAIGADKIGIKFKPNQVYGITGVSGTFGKVLNQQNVEKYLEINSASKAKMVAEEKEKNLGLPVKYIRYGFNPLSRYPIYQLSGGKYLITNFYFLFKRTAQAAYWDLRAYFHSLNKQDFLNAFGEAFESYVYDLLDNYFISQVQKIDNMLDWSTIKGNNQKADLFIKSKNCIFIFECKSSLISYKSKYDKQILDKWISNNLVSAVGQLQNTEKILVKRNLLHNPKVYKLIVTLDDLRGEYPSVREKITDDENIFIVRVFELEVIEEYIIKFGLDTILEKSKEIRFSGDKKKGFDLIFACRELSSELKMHNSMLQAKFHQNFLDLGLHTDEN